jgi:hypothetical protein
MVNWMSNFFHGQFSYHSEPKTELDKAKARLAGFAPQDNKAKAYIKDFSQTMIAKLFEGLHTLYIELQDMENMDKETRSHPHQDTGVALIGWDQTLHLCTSCTEKLIILLNTWRPYTCRCWSKLLYWAP